MKGRKLKPDDRTEYPRQILVAENHEEMRRLLSRTLRGAGFRVTECADGPRFLYYLHPDPLIHFRRKFDLVIADIKMPYITGLEVLEIVKKTVGFPPTIIITAFADATVLSKAEQLGVVAVLDKPFEIEDLLHKVHEILREGGASTQHRSKAYTRIE